MHHLLLFDVDGTLLSCGRQAGRFFLAALEEVFGTVGEPAGYSFAGKTDPAIVLELMGGAGFDEPAILEAMPAVKASYLERLGRELDPTRMRLMPGVLALLEALSRRGDVTLGLLTGNWEQGARTKLEPFGLNRFFDFGAFGEDGADRRLLPPAALERAQSRCGRRFATDQTWIVGDTVHDIDCAGAHGLRVLAVATGTTPRERLEAARPDFLVGSLEEIDPAVHWLGSSTR